MLRARHVRLDAAGLRRILSNPREVCRRLRLDEGARAQPGGLVIRCPWHEDHSPSCSVRVAGDGTIAVHCFGCGETGDVLDLVAVAHSLRQRSDFPEIIRRAADLAGTSGDDVQRAPAPRRAQSRAQTEPQWPSAHEVARVWSLCRAVSDAADVAEWLRKSANGFANRFLWLCVKRSKYLPDGGTFTPAEGVAFVRVLQEALKFARQFGDTPVSRDEDARKLWHDIYPALTADRPGMVGSVLGRAEAQVARVSLLYALLDHSGQIKRAHLEAALALWEYIERSVAYVFGESTGNDVADQVLSELRSSAVGLTRSELHNRFGRNRSSDEITHALRLLERQGLVRLSEPPRERARVAGRPAERWIAATSHRYAVNAVNAERSVAASNSADYRVLPHATKRLR